MSTIVIADKVRIPAWVGDLESFRRWARSDEFPEHGWFSYVNGVLWVDPSMEKVKHNQVKGEITSVLGGLAKKARSGKFFPDRMLLTNLDAGFSTEPDGIFVSWETFRSQRVLLEKGAEEIEMIGTPDLVLEVISRHSVQKDTEALLESYWRAGIREYWLVDSRGQQVTFEIYRFTAKGYVRTRKQAGWLNSTVFGKAFKLTQQTDPVGLPEYTLEVR